MTIETNIIPPVEPQVEITLTGVKNYYVDKTAGSVQVLLSLSQWQQILTQVRQKLADAGVLTTLPL